MTCPSMWMYSICSPQISRSRFRCTVASSRQPGDGFNLNVARSPARATPSTEAINTSAKKTRIGTYFGLCFNKSVSRICLKSTSEKLVA